MTWKNISYFKFTRVFEMFVLRKKLEMRVNNILFHSFTGG